MNRNRHSCTARAGAWLVVALLLLFASPLFAGGRAEQNGMQIGSDNASASVAATTASDLTAYEDPANLRELLASGNEPFFLVDVRTPQEYEAGHIPGAMQRDYTVIGSDPPTDDRDALIIVYCRSGNRSGQAYRTLKEAGHTRLVDFGAVSRWPWDLALGSDPGQIE